MGCISAKFESKVVTLERKDARITSVAQDLLEFDKNPGNFIKTIQIEDESWVYGYNPETKAFFRVKNLKFFQN